MAGTRPGAGAPARRLALRTLAWSGALSTVLAPAHAITLGEIAIESSLGQSLEARIPVDLAAGEVLGAACTATTGNSSTGLARLPAPAATMPEATGPGRHDLRLTTARPLYEPMYELSLELRCPGNAVLVRQYVLMLDLPGAQLPAQVAAPVISGTQVSTAADPAPSRPEPGPAAARPRPAAAGALSRGTVYRVRPGDTLSTIAARIVDRGGASIWQVADVIFAANPQAFIDANPDRIRAGVEIALPGVLADAVPAATAPMPAAQGEGVDLAPSTPPPAPAVEATATERAPPPEAITTSAPETIPVVAEPPEPSVAEESVVPPAEPAPPVFQDEQSPAAPAAEVAAQEPRDSGAPPWLAALVGVLLGAGASLALLRDRLIGALRRPAAATGSTPAPVAAPVVAREPAVSRPLATREPAMVVVEGPRYAEAEEPVRDVAPTDRQPAIVPPRATAEPTSELAVLFGDTPDLPLEEFDATAGLPAADHDLDLDLSEAESDVQIDQDIGWLDDMEETALTPTDQRARTARMATGDTVEQPDLQTLSQKAIGDDEVSDTLKEALELLERDYEVELTASQFVDRAKLREAMDGGDDDEDTLIRTGTDKIPRR